nr:hypothetical protein K-LCC10_0126 [Kaumoebavirus]
MEHIDSIQYSIERWLPWYKVPESCEEIGERMYTYLLKSDSDELILMIRRYASGEWNVELNPANNEAPLYFMRTTYSNYLLVRALQEACLGYIETYDPDIKSLEHWRLWRKRHEDLRQKMGSNYRRDTLSMAENAVNLEELRKYLPPFLDSPDYPKIVENLTNYFKYLPLSPEYEKAHEDFKNLI